MVQLMYSCSFLSSSSSFPFLFLFSSYSFYFCLIDVTIDSQEGTVFDCYPNTQGKMVLWDSMVPAYSPPSDAYLVTKVFVPTVETLRITFVMDLLVKLKNPVLLVGTAGTGKTTNGMKMLANT